MLFNIKFLVFLDHWLGIIICFIFSLVHKLNGKRFNSKVPLKRILIILLTEKGSLVLAQPMFHYLKNKLPLSEIFLLVFDHNLELLDLVDACPPENRITVRTHSASVLIADTVRAWIRFREIGFDAVIDCELFSRISSIYSFLTGAPVKTGFFGFHQKGLYRGDFINRKVIYNPYCHISQQFLNLVDSLEGEEQPSTKNELLPLNVYAAPSKLLPEELTLMADRLELDFPGIFENRLVLIYPGGGLLPIRAWPRENYVDLIKTLQEAGCVAGIIGPPEDKNLARTIISDCGGIRCFDLTGYTRNIRELLLVFRLTSLLITNDGGPGHFSSLTATPAIIIYGPETPVLYASLNPHAVHLYRPFSCSPCLTAYNSRMTPCDGRRECLLSITPVQVLNLALEILEGVMDNGLDK